MHPAELFDKDLGETAAFDFRPLARPTDPPTSKAAARKVNQSESQSWVLATLGENGPQTDEQIEAHVQGAMVFIGAAPFTGSRLRTARHELVTAGKVIQAGESKTRTGHRCAVWRLKS